MRAGSVSVVAIVLAASACSGEHGTTTAPVTPPPPAPAVLLKDMVLSSLPSPYYHFDYDTVGRVTAASFASGARMYDVVYEGERIKELRNNVLVNHDRLVYVYGDATSQRVNAVRYVDPTGATFTVVIFLYDGDKLVGMERDQRVTGGFIIDKTVSLSYYPDGNLLELTEHRPAIEGVQDETTTVDRYEGYDDKINVDGFSLLHDDFFDHFVLLPGLRLQKGNPRTVTRTGDGINFTVDYTYVYDDRNRPLAKNGELTITNGADAGRRIEIGSVFSYY